jgi:imidazole glycerol phosphate synthase subunit HisF
MSEVRGAGELLISVITKGQQEHEAAFELLSEITSSTHLPILASIGISSVEDFGKLFSIPGIDGIVTGYFLKKDAASIQEIKSQLEGIS